jgi:hypothetical protein
MEPTTEQYLRLGLRLGRHVDGLVDAYYGPAGLTAQTDAEPLRDPATLVADADALLDHLDDGWLRDQARGLRTYAGVLAGERLSYADEVEGCYGVRPQPVSTDVYVAVHERLEELLPGTGPLGDRYTAWREATAVPLERIVPALRDIAAELRAPAAELVHLPDGEGLELEEVRDEPWWAFNYYLGDLQSRVAVNVDVLTTCDDVVELAAHEVYPGHHTEHAVKEQLLIRGRGLLEESIQLVPTPSALLAEGIAESGPDLVLRGDVPERLVHALRRHGLDYDPDHARAVRSARRPLRRIGLDAALLTHDDGASPAEAQEHVERWSLSTPEQAAQTVRFVTDPTWRAYTITYSAGRELCTAFVAGDPARFRRLLTEHVRVGELVASVSSAT